MKGCLAWQERGLCVPPVVEKATEDYRAEMDVLEAFIRECCAIKPHAQVKKGDLHKAYVEWCRESGEESDGKITFGKRLQESEHRIVDDKKDGDWVWKGIGLLSRSPVCHVDGS